MKLETGNENGIQKNDSDHMANNRNVAGSGYVDIAVLSELVVRHSANYQ